jgi:hypothetical protein
MVKFSNSNIIINPNKSDENEGKPKKKNTEKNNKNSQILNKVELINLNYIYIIRIIFPITKLHFIYTI